MELVCNNCGAEFTARRGAKYCSPRCRTEAHRIRTGTKGQPRRRRPLREAWDDHTRTIMRRAEALERLSVDVRFSRNARAGSLSRGEILRSITILEGILEKLPEPESLQSSRR